MKLENIGNKYVLTGEVECSSCKGTGLYIGMAERDGAAVVCSSCKGTGCKSIKITYTEFTERKKKKGIKRVFDTAGGYVISDKDVETKEGRLIRFSEGGVSYTNWLNGANPRPIKDLHCPYQHTQQSMQNSSHKWNKYYQIACRVNRGFGMISDCKKRNCMAECWCEVEKLHKDY